MQRVMDDLFDLLCIDFTLSSAPRFDTSERINTVRLEPFTPFTNSDYCNTEPISDMGVGFTLGSEKNNLGSPHECLWRVVCTYP